MQSEIYQKYERDYLKVIPPKVKVHIDEPVNIKAIYYRQRKRKVDITNLHSALHDVLVKAGVIVDDNSLIVIGTDGSRVKYDKNNPRTEVYIESAKDELYQLSMKIESDF